MVALRLSNFGGMIPIRDNRTLPDTAATNALNVRMNTGGTLRGVKDVGLVQAVSSSTKSVFRIPKAGTPSLQNSFWMQFTDPDTSVVRTPLVNDQFKRIYWASPTDGMKFNTEARVLAGLGAYKVGVPPPTTSPNIEVISTSGARDEEGNLTGPQVTRSYAYTYINEYGEESMPGPTIEGVGGSDQQWLIKDIANPPVVAGQPAITEKRLYRTITSSTGVTTFFKVIDMPVGLTNHLDMVSDAALSSTQLDSETWEGPPEGLQGIIGMPNGIMVGWIGNTLYFSENYRPHAWPSIYRVTVEYPIVGLGVFGNTCVVCTTGHPATVTGTKSASMSFTVSGAALPCVSRASIVSIPEGVVYASQTGLVLIGPTGIHEITRDMISREQWETLYQPKRWRAIFGNGVYTAFHGSGGDPDAHAISREQGVVNIAVSGAVVGAGTEMWGGKSWVIMNNALYEWQKPAAVELPYVWKSKEMPVARPCNFSVAQIFFDEQAGSVLLEVWAYLRGATANEKQLVFSGTITQSGREIRLPSGFVSDVWQFGLSGSTPVQALHAATSVAELRGV
jgi:hypothetical protein